MRVLVLALSGLMFAAAFANAPALAAKRSGPAEGMRAPARPAASAPAVKGPAMVARPHRGGLHRPRPALHRGAPVRPVARFRAAEADGATCGWRSAARCGMASLARGRMAWADGLPPAAGVQASECPDGTLATLARGYDDVVRCLPL